MYARVNGPPHGRRSASARAPGGRRRGVAYLTILLIVTSLAMVGCGGEEEAPVQEDTVPTATGSQQTTGSEAAATELGWDTMPVFEGAVLEVSEGCVDQWAQCEACEHRIYVTDSSSEDVCAFYESAMEGTGWTKLVFQNYQEGSCMGTWMRPAQDARILMTVGRRASDDKTFAAITMGLGCP